MTAFLFRKYFALIILPWAWVLRVLLYIAQSVSYNLEASFSYCMEASDSAYLHALDLLREGYKETKGGQADEDT